MMDSRLYITDGAEQKGPYLLPQVKAMWLNGQLTADALYWSDGMSDWSSLADLMQTTAGLENPEAQENDSSPPEEIFIEHAGAGRITTNYPQGLLFDLAYEVLESYGVAIGDSIAGSVIVGQTAMNWSSFGQAIRLDIDYHPRGCAVSVSSSSSQLYDWGRGKKDQQEIIERLIKAIQDQEQ